MGTRNVDTRAQKVSVLWEAAPHDGWLPPPWHLCQATTAAVPHGHCSSHTTIAARLCAALFGVFPRWSCFPRPSAAMTAYNSMFCNALPSLFFPHSCTLMVFPLSSHLACIVQLLCVPRSAPAGHHRPTQVNSPKPLHMQLPRQLHHPSTCCTAHPQPCHKQSPL